MIFKTTLLASLATTALAAIESVEVIHIIEAARREGLPVPGLFSINAVAPGALFARQSSRNECVRRINDIAEDLPLPTDEELSNWVQFELLPGGCTLSAPSSLSSPIMSYITEFLDWTWDVEPEAQKILKDCEQYIDGDINPDLACGESGGTILFTGNNGTSTLPMATALADYTHSNMPSSTDASGSAAPRSIAMSGAAIAVGLLAAAFTL